MSAELGKALLLAQHAMPKIGLDSENPHFRSKFVSLPKLLETVRPVLNANGLVLIQSPCVLLSGEQGLRTEIRHAETGEQVVSEMALMLAKSDAQAQGSAITYARRYAILSMLGLAGDEDDDGNTASSAPARPSIPRGAGPGPDQPSPVERAQAAQAANRVPPPDGGDAEQVVIEFGKHKGQKITDVPSGYVEWLATKFEAKNDHQRRVKVAAFLLTGLGAHDEIPPPIPDDEIPF